MGHAKPLVAMLPLMPSRNALNCGRPQKNTMTARMMNGIHARMTSPKE
jgi:hypothetical protein